MARCRQTARQLSKVRRSFPKLRGSSRLPALTLTRSFQRQPVCPAGFCLPSSPLETAAFPQSRLSSSASAAALVSPPTSAAALLSVTPPPWSRAGIRRTSTPSRLRNDLPSLGFLPPVSLSSLGAVIVGVVNHRLRCWTPERKVWWSDLHVRRGPARGNGNVRPLRPLGRREEKLQHLS